jgi:UDP-glucuronate 4-epimerase
MRILVTGAAGFIGGNLLSTLKTSGLDFVGLDNFSTYYSPEMKRAHISSLDLNDRVIKMDITSRGELKTIFRDFRPSHVVHLAAQGGVRASRNDPWPYLSTNQIGFQNVVELCEENSVEKLLYASSSSVYGQGLTPPFKESDDLPTPKSLYALSKLSNEIVAGNFPSNFTQRIGMRFFTVYGPWGRPDMIVFRILASSVLKKEFKLTANKELIRDFTYVQDVSNTIISLLNLGSSKGRHEIFNIAGSNPETLRTLFNITEGLGYPVKIEQEGSDPMDVNITHASVSKLEEWDMVAPSTPLNVGISNTIDWINKLDPKKILSWYDSIKI